MIPQNIFAQRMGVGANPVIPQGQMPQPQVPQNQLRMGGEMPMPAPGARPPMAPMQTPPASPVQAPGMFNLQAMRPAMAAGVIPQNFLRQRMMSY